jgi:hypothetical protein
MIRNNLRVLEQKVNASDPPSPRLRRARQTERSGQVRSATVRHALLQLAHHVQHPVQKQGRLSSRTFHGIRDSPYAIPDLPDD